MKMLARFAGLSVGIALLGAGCMGLGAVAVVGGIAYYKSSHHESATVNLDAPADRVYDKALETIASHGNVKITKQDAKARLIEMSQGDREISLKITSLSPELTQLTLTSDVEKGQPGSPDVMVERVGQICDALGVPHHVVE